MLHVMTTGRLTAQPKSTNAPSTATALPATTGNRSKKPIEGLWRPDGLGATSVGFAILRVEPKNL
jgi:hypothetical protein